MKHSDPKIEHLKTIELFSACTHDELALISSKTTPHHAKAGEVLAGEGRVGHEFVVIVEGTAKVMVGGQQVASLGPGDFFGEVALLDNGPRTATVIAETDLVAEVSSHGEFQDLVAGAPSVSHKMLVGLAHRLRAANLHLAT